MHIVGWIGAAASPTAAGLWLYAPLLEVPDNQDTFIYELQRISRWNAYAAVAACVAAVCAGIAFVRSAIL